MSKAFKSRSAVDVIISIVTVLLIIGLIGGLVVWLSREEGLTVYVEYNEKRYTVMSDTTLGQLDAGTHKFAVGSFTGDSFDYTVSVAANTEKSFNSVSDGRVYKWADVDCSTIFTIDKRNDGFDLVIPDGTDITSFIRSRYSDDFYYCKSMPDNNEYFVLSVTTSSGAISFPFGCALGEKVYAPLPPDATITLSPDTLVL